MDVSFAMAKGSKKTQWRKKSDVKDVEEHDGEEERCSAQAAVPNEQLFVVDKGKRFMTDVPCLICDHRCRAGGKKKKEKKLWIQRYIDQSAGIAGNRPKATRYALLVSTSYRCSLFF